MFKEFKIICKVIIFLTFTFISSSHGQYIVQQIEYELPVNYNLLPEDAEFDTPSEEAKFFLNIPESKLKQAAESEGRELDIQKSTIYIDGDNIAIENISESGKVTMISNNSKDRIYYIIWSSKKVYEIKPEDFREIEKQAKAVSEEMLKSLSPELRGQVKAEMQKKSPQIKYEAKSTGRKMKKYEFDCEQYIIDTEKEIISLWVTDDTFSIIPKIHQATKKITAIFPSDGNEDIDEWELVPGKIPVVVSKFKLDMMNEPVLEISAITKIVKTKPSADKFHIPGNKDGFTTGSMQDMMKQMMPDENNE
ncbi:MAG: hypothetical protein D6707_04190 [Bacteroidetes bacterium]|nr:MAG: hypothetical protein D6707_04190 [Bacteroidota bacterium]